MMEFIQEKHQIAIATVMFACEALTYLYGPFYFQYVSREWRWM
jgi:hypothetical protein